MNGLVENTTLINSDVDITVNSFARLKKLGAKKGFVTYDDILFVYPEAEQDVDFLDQLYIALRQAGLSYQESNTPIENTGNDDAEVAEPGRNGGRPKYESSNPILNVELTNLVDLYFYEATRHPLLKIEEEVDLAKRMEAGSQARDELLKAKTRSDERYKELMFLIEDSSTALELLISSNSRLVISIAKKYTNRGIPFLDLIQEGNIGLMRAAKRFDYKRGFKFSTYATWWIRQAVTRALADQSRTIRLPVHTSETLSKTFRLKHQLKQQLGRDPNTEEIAEAMGVTTEKIRQLFKYAQIPLSLDMPVSFESDSVLGDFIEDQDAPDPDEMATLSFLRHNLDQAFELLPPREAQILNLRYGLSTGEALTLREVGLKMGVTRERIRQIEAQALRRLRKPEIQNKLRSFLSQQ
jgi:RNA polymerase primary sigma factor